MKRRGMRSARTADGPGLVSRRTFVQAMAATGAALTLGVRWSAGAGDASSTFRPDAWIAIADNGTVTLTVARSEMGQGVRTALPMILAEELEADWRRIVVAQASPGPAFKDMGTGGSDSVAASWAPLRKAGAAAREMLVSAAAQTWGVDRALCVAQAGAVHHRASGRSLDYGALATAAAAMPVPADPPLKARADYRLVGQPVKRLDGPAIVLGTATYGLDVRIPGMRYAAVLRSPAIGGTVATWDGTAARAIRGVRDVVQVSTGIAVVADSTWAALRGRDALSVSWSPGTAPTFDSDQFRLRLEEAAERPGVETRREGDAPTALAGAARRLDALYSYPFHTHAAVEPMSYVAHVQDGRCDLWGGTQNPQGVQRDVAKLLGLAPERVEVHVTLIGGAFGRRLLSDFAVEAAEVSRAARAPVQVVWTRADDMQHGHFHPATVHRMSAGLDAAGRPVAWLHRKAGSFLSAFAPSPEELKDPATYRDDTWGQYDIPYALPAILNDYSVIDCPVRTGPWRAVYSPPCTFARECFLDEIAQAAGRDPLDLRLGLLPAPSMLKVGRLSIDRARYRRVLETAAREAGWGTPLAPREGRRSGRGIAGNVYDGATHVAYVAEVSVGAKGDLQVHRIVCAVDCGVAVNPLGIAGQVESGILFGLSAALKGEITFREGRPQQSSYVDYPVLRFREAPRVEVHVLESDARPSGMGEPPVPPAAPAVLNAVFAATGRRIRRLPLKPGDLTSGQRLI